MVGRSSRRAGYGDGRAAPYPRTARVNQVLREVVADELERLADVDDRLRLLTVTDVETSPDLRQATVYLSSLPETAAPALEEQRPRLQRVVGRQVRLKRTPQLAFTADPAVAGGARVDELIRHLRHGAGGHEATAGDPGPGRGTPPVTPGMPPAPPGSDG